MSDIEHWIGLDAWCRVTGEFLGLVEDTIPREGLLLIRQTPGQKSLHRHAVVSCLAKDPGLRFRLRRHDKTRMIAGAAIVAAVCFGLLGSVFAKIAEGKRIRESAVELSPEQTVMVHRRTWRNFALNLCGTRDRPWTTVDDGMANNEYLCPDCGAAE